jgi:predicted site-specific integrase-resolvase
MVTTLSIGAAALMLGVCVNTLRAWHTSGFLVPIYRTKGGHRRYDPSDVAKIMRSDGDEKPRVTVASARVSTRDQKKDLVTQVERLKVECASRGWPNVEVVTDLGSGMNYNKKGLRQIIGRLCRREVGRLVILRQDRLLRFGAELVFELCRLVDLSVVRSSSSNLSTAIQGRPSPRTCWRSSPCFRRDATA